MKQKRSKSQLNEVGSKLQNQQSTVNGGNIPVNAKTDSKSLECAQGICSVSWKPDSLKR